MNDWNIDVRPIAAISDYSTGTINVNNEVGSLGIYLNDELIQTVYSTEIAYNVVGAIKNLIKKFASDEDESVCDCECNAEYLITEYTQNSENSDPEVYQYVADAEMMGTAVAEAIENGFKIVNQNDLAEECNLSLYFEESGDYPVGCVVVVKIN